MYRSSPFRSTCKVCTEAVHSVALWTRVTLGLGMCKVCTEALDMPEVCISCSVSFSAQNVSKNNPRLQMHETARPVYEMHINTRFPLGSTSEKMRANEGSEGTTTTTTKQQQSNTTQCGKHCRTGMSVVGGRRGAFSTSIDVCGSVAPGTPLRFLVVGATRAAPQLRFAWPAWRFQYEHRCLRKCGAWDAAAFSGGRRDTCSTSASFCVAGVAFSVPGTPPRFVVPCVTLAATQPRFAWPAWRFQYEHRY